MRRIITFYADGNRKRDAFARRAEHFLTVYQAANRPCHSTATRLSPHGREAPHCQWTFFFLLQLHRHQQNDREREMLYRYTTSHSPP